MSFLTSFESTRREGWGYADSATTFSSVNSSTLGPNDETNPPAVNQADSPAVENSSRILEDSKDKEVGINVDFTGEWDGRCKARPVVAGYDWAPHDVKLYTSYFVTDRSIKGLANRVCLVKAANDADCFKLAVCQMTEQTCHDREGDFKGNFLNVAFLESSMTLEELEVISQLSQLPLKSSSRTLIGYLGSKNLHIRVFDYLKRSDEECSSRPPITPKPTVVQTSSVDLEAARPKHMGGPTSSIRSFPEGEGILQGMTEEEASRWRLGRIGRGVNISRSWNPERTERSPQEKAARGRRTLGRPFLGPLALEVSHPRRAPF
ncbi:hypothetical protein LR48_Vigan04g109200 [Vigna angularis]|uniref:Uncharacterized protein n=1 Tax=Phaseolus angularis TaxID=3914 RepID=A0A0L9UEC7_PHAAN|nr:hypothetical protein LR48_Vigan04g109200 [Vigna angularis]